MASESPQTGHTLHRLTKAMAGPKDLAALPFLLRALDSPPSTPH